MSHQVPWNKVIVEEFIKEALLSEDEEMIIRTRVAGWSRTKQCDELGISMSTLDKMIALLKVKYDKVAKYDVLLPPRKSSKQETWMDNN